MNRHESQTFGADAQASSLARRFVTDAVTRMVPASNALIDDVVLATSELVTNAVTASRTDFDAQIVVTVEVLQADVRISVSDEAVGMPRPMNALNVDVHGRGLAIVDALARRWGVDVTSPGPGKTVWASFPVGLD